MASTSASLRRKAIAILMKQRNVSFLLRPVYILLLIPVLFLTLRSLLWAIQPQARAVPIPTASFESELSEAELLLPKCSKATEKRAKSFVLLFMGHSGSTALISTLKQHPQVYIEGYEPVDHGYIAGNTREALAYARAFFKTGLRMKKTAGFKIRPRHLLTAPREWASLFEEFDTKIIWNYRANVFKQSIGHYPIMYMNDTSRYEGLSLQDADKKNNDRKKKPHINEFRIHDMTAFYKLLSSRYRGERRVENAVAALSAKTCVLPLSYELLLENPTQMSLLMQAFLNLRVNRALQPARRKATDDNMCKVVTNWDEVCHAFFLCHRWRGMMGDTRTGCTCPVVTGVKSSYAHRFCVPAQENIPRRNSRNMNGYKKNV